MTRSAGTPAALPRPAPAPPRPALPRPAAALPGPAQAGQQRVSPQRAGTRRSRQQSLRQLTGIGLPEILDDKLRPPRLTLAVLRRGRVSGLLDSAVRHRVTVVSGPAGAGKTVACAAWAAARPAALAPAWLTVDAGDREPLRFWQYVLAALVRSGALAAGNARPLTAAPAEAYAPRIAATLRMLPHPVVLIIDDVHELAGSSALAGLDVLIRHAPAGFRLVLSGRWPPQLALARLRVAGELADIGATDLAATGPEADAYHAMLGLAISPADRAARLARTEGWMAGLRLLALAAPAGAGAGAAGPGAGPGAAGPSTGPGAPEPIVIDYVRDEILSHQPPHVRRFLMRTSVVASLSGELADALTGEPATGARTLEWLSRRNSLVTSPAPGRTDYRYHPMLREVLAAELRRELAREVPVLLGRAARWHAARDQLVPALQAAAQAGDRELASQILAQAGPVVSPAGQLAELEAVLAACPPAWRADDAPVAAALAAARLGRGDADGASLPLDCARRAITRCDDHARRTLEPWLSALQVLQRAGQGSAAPDWIARQQSGAEQAEAAAVTVGDHRAAGLLWFAVGCARLGRQEIQQARGALARASAQLAAGSLPVLRRRVLAWQALATAQAGDLTAADQLVAAAQPAPAAATRALALADSPAPALAASQPPVQHQPPALHDPPVQPAPDEADDAVACILELARAQVSLARDELDAACRQLDEADRLSAGWPVSGWLAGEPAPAVLSGLIRAQRAIADGDPAQARGQLLRLRQADPPGQAARGDLLAVLDAEAALLARAQEPAVLLQDLARRALNRPDVQLCRARLLLAAGDDQGALKATAPWRDAPAGAVTTRDRLAALLVACVAHRRQGQGAEAAASVEQALALAQPDRACRAFLDGGLAVRSAITVLVPPASRGADFAARLLERFDVQVPRPAGRPGEAGAPLTASELAVLRFLPSHMTNQEIAEALFLSINTVKTHLRSVYRKLGVASRRQAIARGRRLGLL